MHSNTDVHIRVCKRVIRISFCLLSPYGKYQHTVHLHNLGYTHIRGTDPDIMIRAHAHPHTHTRAALLLSEGLSLCLPYTRQTTRSFEHAAALPGPPTAAATDANTLFSVLREKRFGSFFP